MSDSTDSGPRQGFPDSGTLSISGINTSILPSIEY